MGQILVQMDEDVYNEMGTIVAKSDYFEKILMVLTDAIITEKPLAMNKENSQMYIDSLPMSLIIAEWDKQGLFAKGDE